MGGIRLPKIRVGPQRLDHVYPRIDRPDRTLAPRCRGRGGSLLFVNAKSALKLGQVRGVALLSAARLGLPVAEYAPLRIKSSVVGYGLAQKEQVQFMVARLLGLAEIPEPADAADALAIAICHIHTAQTLTLQGGRAMKAVFLATMADSSLRGCVGQMRSAAVLRVDFLQSRSVAVPLDPRVPSRRKRSFPFRREGRGASTIPGTRSSQYRPRHAGEPQVCRACIPGRPAPANFSIPNAKAT